MNRLEQAQSDASVIWSRMPKNLQEKVRDQWERLDRFLSELQDTAEAEGDWYWLEEEWE